MLYNDTLFYCVFSQRRITLLLVDWLAQCYYNIGDVLGTGESNITAILQGSRSRLNDFNHTATSVLIIVSSDIWKFTDSDATVAFPICECLFAEKRRHHKINAVLQYTHLSADESALYVNICLLG